MSGTATITWSLPEEDEDGHPFPVDKVAFTLVALSADGGANFGVLDPVPGSAEPVTIIPDLEDGDWVVRLSVRGTNGRVGAHVDTLFTIDSSIPGAVQNVVVEVDLV